MRLSIVLAILITGILACNQTELDSSYFPLPGKDLEVVNSESQSFIVDTVVTGLERPWSMAFLPDKSILITERAGNLLIVRNGQVQEKPVDGKVPNELRDIELHPQYKENGWIYISYYIEPDEKDGGYTVLMRARLDGDKLIDGEILYTVGPFEEGGYWYGSKIAFDHDEYLFFTVGIRGVRQNAQDKSKPQGKTMRLHDDGSIPSDNPFVDMPGALPEIYSYGHRMHEGLIIHHETGELWSSEHGEKGGDEVNIIQHGLNYGWPESTYSLNYDGTIITDTLREGMEPPIHHWTPSIAPAGMDFVYGEQYPGWDGNLFVGSLVQRMLNRSVIENNRIVHDEKLLENIGRVRDVKFGPDKFLYVMTEDTGLIVRLLPVK